MSLRWLVLLVPLYSVNVPALELPIEIFEYVDNARVVAFVKESDIDEAAEWKPDSGAPALSINKVVTIANDYAAGNEGMNGAIIEEIALRRIPHHEGKWHYMVKMKTETEEKVRYHYLVVLMNGRSIPAIREPSSIK
jgi:hypothetical protein